MPPLLGHPGSPKLLLNHENSDDHNTYYQYHCCHDHDHGDHDDDDDDDGADNSSSNYYDCNYQLKPYWLIELDVFASSSLIFVPFFPSQFLAIRNTRDL